MVSLPAYRRPWWLCNPHLETIWPSLCRKVAPPAYRRERIDTPDGDFLDLDWLQIGAPRLAVLSHGLEGDSRRTYVAGMANALSAAGWDVLAWNFRGCGGEINRRPCFTHNGSTPDLNAVIQHAIKAHGYQRVVLVGFSMGGNLSLLYLGREATNVPEQVKASVVFSVPCNLAAASDRLAEPGNALYMRRFMRMMGRKVRQQADHFPEIFSFTDYHKLRTFADFDGHYTAPIHGFRDAADYWEQCSSKRHLHLIKVPTWVINACSDPFLSLACSPDQKQHGNPLVQTLTPKEGGHCGFSQWSHEGVYWSEIVTIKLLSVFA